MVNSSEDIKCQAAGIGIPRLVCVAETCQLLLLVAFYHRLLRFYAEAAVIVALLPNTADFLSSFWGRNLYFLPRERHIL
jgi:hypothetical protein